MRFPIQAQIVIGNNDSLICRLNTNPDVDSPFAKGKVFFPDRSCAEDICEGPVIIESVVEHKNHGYFIGKMVQVRCPSDDQLAEYLKARGADHLPIEIMTGKFGTFAYVDGLANYGCGMECLVLNPDGEVEMSYIGEEYARAVSYSERTFHVVDVVCQKRHGFQSFYAVLNEFPLFGYSYLQFTPVVKSKSKVFDKAVKMGFLSLRKTVRKIEYVTLDRDKLSAVINDFTRAELLELIKDVSEINVAANRAIQEGVASGTIKLPKNRN
jgi:hypothetical protein